MREAIRGDEGDNQCPRVPGRSRQGAGVFPWVFQGLSRAWDGAWIPCRVYRVVKAKKVRRRTYRSKSATPNTRSHTREVGNTGSWNCTGATRKNGQRHVLARHRQHKRGAPLFGATPPRPLSLVTCRVLVNSGGHSRLPETSDFPSPQLMQRPLSLPVLLAFICRSMRWQRMMPIGSSSEFPSPQSSV